MPLILPSTVHLPAGAPRGLVAFLHGHGGKLTWSRGDTDAPKVWAACLDAGYACVELRSATGSWETDESAIEALIRYLDAIAPGLPRVWNGFSEGGVIASGAAWLDPLATGFASWMVRPWLATLAAEKYPLRTRDAFCVYGGSDRLGLGPKESTAGRIADFEVAMNDLGRIPNARVYRDPDRRDVPGWPTSTGTDVGGFLPGAGHDMDPPVWKLIAAMRAHLLDGPRG